MNIIRDTALIFQRSMIATLRNPIWVIFGLFQPLCFLLLFAPLLDKLTAVSSFGSAGALTVYTPGLLVMMALYGTSFVGFGLISEIRSGIIERFRVTPINRIALLLGRSLRDVLVLMVQLVFLVLLAGLMGMSAPLLGIVVAFIPVLLVGFTMSMISYTIALKIPSEDALAPILNFFLLPLQLLAGITLPLAMAPVWLQRVAWFNPLAHAVNAARDLYVGQYTTTPVLLGFAVMIVGTLIAYAVASSTFKHVAE